MCVQAAANHDFCQAQGYQLWICARMCFNCWKLNHIRGQINPPFEKIWILLRYPLLKDMTLKNWTNGCKFSNCQVHIWEIWFNMSKFQSFQQICGNIDIIRMICRVEKWMWMTQKWMKDSLWWREKLELGLRGSLWIKNVWENLFKGFWISF